MALSLSPETQKLIEDRVKSGGYPSADELVSQALEFLDLYAEDLDDETLAAIEEGEAQLDRDEGIPLDEAMGRLRQKYSQK